MRLCIFFISSDNQSLFFLTPFLSFLLPFSLMKIGTINIFSHLVQCSGNHTEKNFYPALRRLLFILLKWIMYFPYICLLHLAEEIAFNVFLTSHDLYRFILPEKTLTQVADAHLYGYFIFILFLLSLTFSSRALVKKQMILSNVQSATVDPLGSCCLRVHFRTQVSFRSG